METKTLDQQKEINSAQNLTKASEDSNKRMNLSSENHLSGLMKIAESFLLLDILVKVYVQKSE